MPPAASKITSQEQRKVTIESEACDVVAAQETSEEVFWQSGGRRGRTVNAG
jgi:hypothetical protein